MRTARVLLASAVAHAALFAVLGQITAKESRRRAVPLRPGLEPIEVVTIEPDREPIEVVMLEPVPAPVPDLPSAAAKPRVSSEPPLVTAASQAVAAARHVAAVESSAAGATAGGVNRAPEPGPTGDTGQGPSAGDSGGANLLRMRGVELGLDPAVAARIAEAGGGRARIDELKPSGELKDAGGGRAVARKTVTTMTMEPDGNVTFADEPDIDVKLKLPIPRIDVKGMREDLGKLLTEWYADPYAGTRFGRMQDVARHITAVPGACDSWGDVWCDDPLAPKTERYAREQKKTRGSLAGGKLDITSYLHRKYVGDPYASLKLKLLDDTRDERVARGSVYRAQQRARSAELMRKNLERLWTSTSDPLARKAALFELWDECGEGEGADGEAGQRARLLVIGWIRARLPIGSASAYTDDELAVLAARRTSRQPFAPYAGADTVVPPSR